MTTGGAVLVEARSLTRVFGRGDAQVRAVDGVSFAVGAGEIVAIAGESGSGKTTLARLLLRLLDPTSGTLVASDRDVTRLRGRQLDAYRRDVQAVFQDPVSAFSQFFTVHRVLGRSRGLLTGVSPAELEIRIASALASVGMTGDVLDKYPHQLSGGQRQRIMIARALMMHPKLLVADEATSMLDASLRANVLNVLADLRAETGLAVLFITHDLGQACYVSDRVLVMRRGELVESGPAEEVLFSPRHEYTRRLLADVPTLHPRGPGQ